MESSGVERIVLVREVDMTVLTQYCSPCQSQRKARDGMKNVTVHSTPALEPHSYYKNLSSTLRPQSSSIFTIYIVKC